MSFLKASFSAKSYFAAVWFAPGDESGVPEDELRPEYRGGTGRMLPARDSFSDATDADLERLVLDKWEAIEARREHVPENDFGDIQPTVDLPAGDQNPIKSEKPDHSERPLELVLPAPGNRQEKLNSSPLPTPAVVDAASAAMLTHARTAEAALRKRRQAEETALVLMLLEA